MLCYNYLKLIQQEEQIMSRLNIKEKNISFRIYEGDIHEVNTEDGIGYYPISWVIAEVGDKDYMFPTHFLAKFVEIDDPECDDGYYFATSKSLCEDFIQSVKEVGSINLDKWELCVEQEYDLEQEWKNDFQREQEDRGLLA